VRAKKYTNPEHIVARTAPEAPYVGIRAMLRAKFRKNASKEHSIAYDVFLVIDIPATVTSDKI